MSDKPDPNPWPVVYATLLPTIRAIARRHGYGVGLHGSMVNDLDLIAVPWRDDASTGREMVEAVSAEIAESRVGYRPNNGLAPGGRQGYSIILDRSSYGHVTQGYIDFTVTDPRHKQ